MEKIIYYFIHLLIPVIIVVIKVFYNPKSKIALITSSALSLSVLCFLYFWGQWPLVGSYYFRYLILGALLFFVAYSITEFRQEKPFFPKKPSKYLMIIPAGLLSILIIVMDINLIVVSKYPDDGVHMEFPLKNGKYYISSGGSNRLVNNHFSNYPNSQQYALDINKLGKYGGAFGNIFSKHVSNHHIFSDTVYCPCTGTVIESENTIMDNLTSSMTVEVNSGKGNFVTIDCDGILVSLYHLKMNSVVSPANSQLSAGDPIGLVGNSGFSQEPHLHIQASKYNSDSVNIGVPIKFEDRYLSRNDVISNH